MILCSFLRGAASRGGSWMTVLFATIVADVPSTLGRILFQWFFGPLGSCHVISFGNAPKALSQASFTILVSDCLCT